VELHPGRLGAGTVLMATVSKNNGSEWRARGVLRRDFRASKDEPEVPKKGPRSLKSKRLKRWCRGKEGQEHAYTFVPERLFLLPNWGVYRCSRCGREEWRRRC